MRIVYMGTPDIAASVLSRLLELPYEVVLVVTQPDRPKGRGKELAASPVKLLAEERGIPVFQPEKIRLPENVAVIREAKPDMIVVVAFGQILRADILNMPKYGCINVHASLLPAYRGAAPIQWAIMDGKKETGITIMYMNEGIDTGDILLQQTVPIAEDETGGSLHDKLAAAGGDALVKAIPLLLEGKLKPVPQGEMTTAYAKQLKKDMGKLDFTRPAEELEHWIRGLNPWPSAYTSLHGKTLKIWEAKAVSGTGEPGTVLEITKDAFLIAAGEGALSVRSVQLEGKRRMTSEEFLRGNSLCEGEKLGE